MNKFILIIGLVILLLGFALISLTLSGVIQNVQEKHLRYDAYNPVLKVSQLQPTEFILFSEVLEPEDKVQLHLEPLVGDRETLAETGTSWRLLYDLGVDIKDSGNVTMEHYYYDAESLPITNNILERVPIDIYFQPPKHDSYNVSVTYTAWSEVRDFGEEWVLDDWESTTRILTLNADLTVIKSTPNSTYLTYGYALVGVGVVLSIFALVTKFKFLREDFQENEIK